MFKMQRSLSTPSQNDSSRFANRNFNQTPVFQRRRSNSTSNCIIEKKRGFRPSDRFDPIKREFLVQLGKKFWCRPVRIFVSNSNFLTLSLPLSSIHAPWIINRSVNVFISCRKLFIANGTKNRIEKMDRNPPHKKQTKRTKQITTTFVWTLITLPISVSMQR